MTTQSQPAIRLQKVSKRFAFTPDTPQSVLESLISVVSRRRAQAQDLWAVRDVSFEVQPGQCVGIIGRNGSGKSSLLKLIARIIQPTSGQIEVRGRVSALLELGAGFHPDLTGRENIYLNASVLGLSQQETEALFDDIVAFSELGSFIDMPVKHYSSGMYMRLGFSVAIHVRPDILIVDEILAVGDQSFQAKCIDRIVEMKREGVTILFISHDLSTIGRLCSEVVWLEQGRVVQIGSTDHILAQYRDHLFQRVGQQLSIENEAGGYRRWGTRQIEITGVRLLNDANEETTIFHTGDSLRVEIAYAAHEPIVEPEFGLALYRHDGLHLNGPNTRVGGLEMGVVEGNGVVSYTIERLPFLPGRYQMTAAIHDGQRPLAYDFHEEAYAFRVIEGGTREKDGLLALDAKWEWYSLPVDETAEMAYPATGLPDHQR
ncbi:MAG: ABC transporter ATP-binding protein [Candidatus Promineofilum sp.]|nr:ABC transporter ATP-binding protein [Promineifilum sp.]MCW5862110.1 ABC transporter ATP-binding protein [Anaerolineae bacterium]